MPIPRHAEVFRTSLCLAILFSCLGEPAVSQTVVLVSFDINLPEMTSFWYPANPSLNNEEAIATVISKVQEHLADYLEETQPWLFAPCPSKLLSLEPLPRLSFCLMRSGPSEAMVKVFADENPTEACARKSTRSLFADRLWDPAEFGMETGKSWDEQSESLPEAVVSILGDRFDLELRDWLKRHVPVTKEVEWEDSKDNGPPFLVLPLTERLRKRLTHSAFSLPGRIRDDEKRAAAVVEIGAAATRYSLEHVEDGYLLATPNEMTDPENKIIEILGPTVVIRQMGEVSLSKDVTVREVYLKTYKEPRAWKSYGEGE